jgi:hypothetical protein
VIGIKDSLLQSNLDHRNIERATTFLQTLALEDLRFPYHTLTAFRLSPRAWRSGEVLFWNDGPWEFQQVITQFAQADNWAEDEVGIVPFPRDPLADEYFQRGKQDALMLVAGSQNHDGFKAWTQAAVIAAQDDTMRFNADEKAKADHGWTDFHLQVLREIRELTIVFDFKNGIGEDVSSGTSESPVENLTKPVITLGDSYTQMRGAERVVIESRIEEINDTVR